MNKSDVVKFAEQQGYTDAEYIGKWKGYDCYEPILSDFDETAFIGLPLLILVDWQGRIRMSTSEEAMKQNQAMTREDFIALAKEYNYNDKGITDLLETYEEMKTVDPRTTYDDVVLIPQPVY